MARTGYFDPPLPRRFAHRGLCSHSPGIDENSLAAFQEALLAGATHIESDTHSTKDGVAVLFHDSNLQRVAGVQRDISEITIGELSSIRLVNGSTIPTLSEVLADFPDLYLNLDIKSEAAIRPTVEAIELHGAHDRVLVSSFSNSRRKKALELLSKPVATSASSQIVLTAYLSHRLFFGFGFKRLTQDVDAFQIPVAKGPLKFASHGFIRRLQGLGKEVHFWTINEPEQMRRLLDLGADGIVTDRVDLLSNLNNS